MRFPALMGSVGGWVFVLDVIRGSVGKTVIMTAPGEGGKEEGKVMGT